MPEVTGTGASAAPATSTGTPAAAPAASTSSLSDGEFFDDLLTSGESGTDEVPKPPSAEDETLEEAPPKPPVDAKPGEGEDPDDEKLIPEHLKDVLRDRGIRSHYVNAEKMRRMGYTLEELEAIREVIPTREDLPVVADAARSLSQMSNDFLSDDPADHDRLLSAFASIDEAATRRFTESVLRQLPQRYPDLANARDTLAFDRFVGSLEKLWEKDPYKAELLANFREAIDDTAANLPRETPAGPTTSREKQELDQYRSRAQQEAEYARSAALSALDQASDQAVFGVIDQELARAIPADALPAELMQEYRGKVMDEVARSLTTQPVVRAYLEQVRRDASRPLQERQQIVAQFLAARARNLVPSVAARVGKPYRAAALKLNQSSVANASRLASNREAGAGQASGRVAPAVPDKRKLSDSELFDALMARG